MLLVAALVAVTGAAVAEQLSAPEWADDFPRLTGRTVRLKWQAVAGAQTYTIYRNGEVAGTSPTTSYSDAGAQVGENRYAIAAVTDEVEGARSPEKSITLKPMQKTTTSSALINYSFLVFLAALVVYVVYLLLSGEGAKAKAGYAGSGLMFLGMAMMTAAILLRWRDAGRPPFSNMYESLILFAWSIAFIYLILELIYKIRIAGVIAVLLTVASIAAASFFNPTIEPLMPALQSNWLAYHVLTCFVGYAAFAVSAAASVLYLILTIRGKRAEGEAGEGASGEIIKAMQSFNYEAVRFGFLFLGVGIITGAVWANEAWGTYWSWDPKETWSLITWIIYAILIHFKFVSGRFGVKDLNMFNAVCSIIGFFAVIFTYFGDQLNREGAKSAKKKTVHDNHEDKRRTRRNRK
jgi:cytochrome c-type biogenesis protein CcsB